MILLKQNLVRAIKPCRSIQRLVSTKLPTPSCDHTLRKGQFSHDIQFNNGGLDKFDFQTRRVNLAKKLARNNPLGMLNAKISPFSN